MISQAAAHPQATRRDVYYSVGVSQTGNLKERIAELHGTDSLAARAVPELERFLTTPEFRQTRWYRAFYRKVLTGMSILDSHVNRAAQFKMAQEYIDDLVHGGYLRTLQSLAVPSGLKHVSFAQECADSYGVSLSEVLIFGPRGGAIRELLQFVAAEKAHGVHRPDICHNPHLSDQSQKCWHNAEKTRRWPIAVNAEGEETPLDPSEEQSHLSEEVIDKLQSLWRRNPALRDYTGAQRLSGDIPYQIIEDAVDVLIQRDSSPLNPFERAMYGQIVESANRQGIDPFYAAYDALLTAALQQCWNQARRWLHDYSMVLWETQNQLWLIEGKRSAAGGVVYRPAKAMAPEPKNKAVPGTLYLNNGRYWWVVARKMKPRPLIDPKSKKKVPGTIFQQGGRYYWVISGVLGRQRLVPKGEKFSTDDRATAEKIAYQKWQQLRKDDPSLAAYILSRRQAQGLATKDRALAEKIAARLWRQIQRDDPQLAAKILQDNRPKGKDHWYAQLVVEGKHRCIGSYTSRGEARAAYTREFEDSFGYPPGYNVQCMPKLDKVWPSWHEEEARLRRMAERPRMPVICPSDDMESLAPMIQKMQKVDWLVGHVAVVFDDDSPVASPDIAIQSRGTAWYEQARSQGRHLVVCGCAYIDADTRRIRITIHRPGFTNRQVLLEEIYHIGLKILFYGSPRLFAAIQRWYRGQLAQGEDPTLSLADRFASTMAAEETGVRTTLPPGVVRSAQRLLSPTNHVPASILQKLITHWSEPLPV
jgi:hypothetical protein